MRDGVEFERNAREPLQQRIVNLARHSCPFRQHQNESFPHLFSYLLQTKTIPSPGSNSGQCRTERKEWIGLVKEGPDTKRDRSARFIPNPIIVAGDDSEEIFPVRQTVDKRPRAARRLRPAIIVTFEFVLEPDALRDQQIDPGVIDFDGSNPRLEAERTIQPERLAIGNQALDVNRRRRIVVAELRRINSRDAFAGGKP